MSTCWLRDANFSVGNSGEENTDQLQVSRFLFLEGFLILKPFIFAFTNINFVFRCYAAEEEHGRLTKHTWLHRF